MTNPQFFVSDFQFSSDGNFLAARIVPLAVIDNHGKKLPFFSDSFATLYLWEIGTIPYLHARLIDKLPHELLGQGSKWDKQSNVSDLAKRLLIEKGSIFS